MPALVFLQKDAPGGVKMLRRQRTAEHRDLSHAEEGDHLVI